MRKKLLLGIAATGISLLLLACATGIAESTAAPTAKVSKVKTVVYFSPEVFPEVAEIQEPTNTAFFSAVSNKLKRLGDYKLVRVNIPQKFDSVDVAEIRDYCLNNGAQAAIVPKVKYFKVGLGKYVFSNQVIVSMKLYNAAGEFVAETSYDTYKANARLLGSAENSIKIGTDGAIKNLTKILRSRRQREQKQVSRL